jgi:tRNA(Ile)-lysidine synthase
MAGSRKFHSTDVVSAAVAACLNNHIGQDERVAVGFSGGLDSVVLLDVLRQHHGRVFAFHVHHGLSSVADHWLAFTRDLCCSWNIPFAVERVVVERDSADGLEAAARRARHAAFSRLDATWIALAHHQDDRAETMLFNLLRGAGVRGAGAMGERNGRLLRPLLRVGREDILAYARLRGLAWIEDESNADTRYARNFLRQQILPAIGRRFPAVRRRLASAAARFAEAADLLDDLARLDLGDQAAAFPTSVTVLARLPEARARNVLRLLLTEQGVGIPSEERLVEALRQCLSAQPDRHPQIAFGPWLMRRRGLSITLERR